MDMPGMENIEAAGGQDNGSSRGSVTCSFAQKDWKLNEL